MANPIDIYTTGQPKHDDKCIHETVQERWDRVEGSLLRGHRNPARGEQGAYLYTSPLYTLPYIRYHIYATIYTLPYIRKHISLFTAWSRLQLVKAGVRSAMQRTVTSGLDIGLTPLTQQLKLV